MLLTEMTKRNDEFCIPSTYIEKGHALTNEVKDSASKNCALFRNATNEVTNFVVMIYQR